MNLLTDTRGSATTNLLSLAPTWLVVFGVFLLNVQLGRTAVQRDMVDHATSIAADATMKILCADARDFGGAPAGQLTGARQTAVRASIDPILSLASSNPRCTVEGRALGDGPAPGTRQVEIDVTCEFPCDVPLAARVMCSGSPPHVTLSAKQTTVAAGCDVGDGA
jgi:hypothetical protein